MFFARATIDGKGPVWFTVDTGATLTVIDPRTASRLGLKVRDLGERQNVGTASAPTAMGATRCAAIRVGDMEPFAPDRMYVVPVSANEKLLGHQIDDVLGTDFLRHCVMEFDYSAGTVTAHDARTFACNGPEAPLTVSLAGHRLLAPSTLTLPDGEQVNAQLLVDTGSNTRLIVTAPCVRKHRLIQRFPSARMTASVGINGLTTSPLITARSLRLGAAIITRPNAGLSRETSGLYASADFDGIIGAELLQSCRVIVDYPRRQMIVERHPTTISRIEPAHRSTHLVDQQGHPRHVSSVSEQVQRRFTSSLSGGSILLPHFPCARPGGFRSGGGRP